MKKLLAILLVLLLVFALCGCMQPGSTYTPAEGMTPEAAAAEAAKEVEDKNELSDLIRVPFGYLLGWLYDLTSNYGVTLIFFSLIIKLVLLPTGVKSKKNMLAMSRLAPELKALEASYGDDKQGYNKAMMALYKEEGVSTTGSCLWSLIPLFILLPLYYCIREPINYMLHNGKSVSAAIVAYIQASGETFGAKSSFYNQLMAASHMGNYIDGLKSCSVTANANLKVINFDFIGVNLAEIPAYKFWTLKGWSQIGLFLIPLVSAASQVFSMILSQKQNDSVATNSNGEVDKSAANTANQTTKSMMYTMPIMTLVIGYSMPAALSIYWIAQAVFGIIQEFFLNKYCKKEYEAEDAERRERARARAEAEAEKERIRALRREENPDGIIGNTSKKKLKAREKAGQEYTPKAQGKQTAEEPEVLRNQKPDTGGEPDRPYCRGRNYVADRYSAEEMNTEE